VSSFPPCLASFSNYTPVIETLATADRVQVSSSVHPPGTGRRTAWRPHATRFVARQPIFTRDERVFGYELLFRDGIEACFSARDMEAACRSTLDSSLLMGLDVLCAGTYAWVNCTREALLKGHATLLPPHSTVVEVLETVAPDAEVEAACRDLKKAGYLVALDDFVPDDAREALTAVADLIKLDLIATPRNQWQKMVARYAPRIQMLAEKVETREDFFATRSMGFTYFQGYFFQRPVIVSATEVPPSKLNFVRMLHVVHQAVIDFGKLEGLIKQEASLCYRLLRYLNSAVFGFAREIRSVRHALSMLGEDEIRRWISLAATVGAGQPGPAELLQTALVRAHFCELVSKRLQRGETEYFLLGLLSLIDAILGMPMSKVLEGLPIDREIKAALLGLPSGLWPLYELMVAQENADWPKCSEIAARFHIPEQDIAEAYLQSVRWAREVMAQ
jgi:c-di-GMP-related signal transduction protein